MTDPTPLKLLNREQAILEFNRRVLAQAQREDVPLLERLRYICIVSSNLDEFFEVRFADMLEAARDPLSTMTSQDVDRVGRAAHALIDEQYLIFNEQLTPLLLKQRIVVLNHADRDEPQRRWVQKFFEREVRPLLVPVGLDPAHPFPQVANKSLHFIARLSGKDAFGRDNRIAIVKVPRVLPRVIKLPASLSDGRQAYVLLTSVIRAHLEELFPGRKVEAFSQFRVTRDSDLEVDEEEIANLRHALRSGLTTRHFGRAVRLEVVKTCPTELSEFLLEQFGLPAAALYRVNGPVNLVRLMQVPDWVDRPDMKFPPFAPGTPKGLTKGANIFDSIRKNDILLHHPYQSFAPVIEFLSQAATDPSVVAIKMTVYRTGTDSVLMESLIRAAQNGKEVTVVVELMARFDEEANIGWATKLEQVGAHVVYGVVGYKTHAKALLIVRREEGGLKRYAHLGTGNYHPRTARLYTDFGLMTANDEVTRDVSEVFKQLTGLGQARTLKHLWQAPFTLQQNVVAGIQAESEIARAGGKARIVAKMNSLIEPEVINAMYEASQAGVEIDLIVRGVCMLRPGVKGLSDNIRVRSIIGRFLEHHRIFYFLAGGKDTVYLSSADWMERNFFKRIELAFPILDAKLKRRVITEGLKFYLADNQQGWEMSNQGIYQRRRSSRSKPHNAQGELMVNLGNS